MLRSIIYFHVYIILDFPITYRNASVLCQSECARLHKTVNMVVFFVESNENTQKGEHSCNCTKLSLWRKEGIVHSFKYYYGFSQPWWQYNELLNDDIYYDKMLKGPST